MKVETFECSEAAAEPLEISEECLSLVQQCGLTGQERLFQKTEQGHDTRSPYRKMTEEERLIYKTLCPDVFKPEDYDGSPIPLRVLQVLAHAKTVELFDAIQIWDRRHADIKDPVLVATSKHPKETWKEEFWILARWGEELDELPALRNKACQVKRQQIQDAVDEIRRKAGKFDVDSLQGVELLKHSVPASFHLD